MRRVGGHHPELAPHNETQPLSAHTGHHTLAATGSLLLPRQRTAQIAAPTAALACLECRLVPLAAALRRSPAEESPAGPHRTSGLASRLTRLCLAAAFPFILLSALYEPDSPERLVTAVPLLAIAAAIAAHRLLGARLTDVFFGAGPKRLTVACGLAYVALLVLGIHPLRDEQRRLLGAAGRIPADALLVSPVENGFLASTRHRGPALYLWPPGRRSSQVTIANGTICGYDATCEVTDDSVSEIVSRALSAGGVFAHESLGSHPLLDAACLSCALSSRDSVLKPLRRLAAVTP